MATAAIPNAPATPASREADRGRFPWRIVLGVWLAVSALLVARFWGDITTGHFSDADDLMRLLQVRDLLAGRGWFDMTQYRLDPPAGLPMHWSRLVDLPLAAFIAPLTPIFGRAAAEMVAVTVVPLATLGITMAALVAAVRRLLRPDPLLAFLAPFMIVIAPAAIIQLFPTRIDHHGWQICLGTIAFAALLDPRERRSGLIAGAATALYLAVSLEGLPYAVAEAGILALLWTISRESPARLTAFLAALAGVSIVVFVGTAPTLRWTTPLCDVVKPAHLLTFAIAAAGVAMAVAATRRRGPAVRLGALALAGIGAAAAFALLAPECVGSPFGHMDPLVRHYWYDNVVEGLPFWDQSIAGAASMLAFPLVGIAGAAVALRRAEDAETRRRWMLALLIGLASFAVGAMVRRAAGLSHVVAIPGALALIQIARAHIERIDRPLLRVPAAAATIFLLSPLMPVWAVAEAAPDPGAVPLRPEQGCGVRCDLDAIGRLPPMVMFTQIDLGPRLIAATHHKAYAGGYHRLEKPIHDTVAAFIGDDRTARAIVCRGGFDAVLIAPKDGETSIFRRAAPDGFLAHLVAGRVPGWLTPVPLPGPALRLYRVRC